MRQHAPLSAFYFGYYAALGAFTPYFARWIVESGHGAWLASVCLSLWYATRIVAPPLWSSLCARSRHPLHWLRGGAWLAAAGFGGLFLVHDSVGVLGRIVVFSFFANAILPQFEAITLERLGPRRAEYGKIRVWGSVGFLVVAGSYGWLLDSIGRAWFPWTMWPLLLATAAIAHTVNAPPPEPHAAPRSASWGEILRVPGAVGFFATVMLMQTGFGAFYVFYTVHLEAHGHSGSTVGLLWAIGVVAEIAMLLGMRRVFERFDARAVMSACLAVTALRWAVVAALPQSLPWMLAMQLLHALSFGAFHAACMQRAVTLFPGRLAHHGQSLLYGLGSGVGGVVGTLLAGVVWEHVGGRASFAVSALVCVLALALVWPRRRAVSTA